MSLRVESRSGRERSRSRSRSRSHSHAPEPQQQYSSQYGAADPAHAHYASEIRQPGQHYATSPAPEPITMGNYSDLPPEERPGYVAAPSFAHPSASSAGPPSGVVYAQAGNVQYAPQSFAYAAPSASSQPAITRTPAASTPGYQYAQTSPNITYTAKPVAPSQPPPPVRNPSQTSQPQYATQPQYTTVPHAPAPPQSVQQSYTPPNVQHSYPPPSVQHSYPPPPLAAHSPAASPRPDHKRNASSSKLSDGRKVVEIVPGGGGGKLNAPPSPGMRPHSLSVGGGGGGGGGRPENLRMDRLSVSGNRPDIQTIVPGGMPGGFPGGALPPPSPLLEAYHGTYQSLSPMPTAMMLDDDLDHLPPLDSLSPRGSRQDVHGRHRAHSKAGRSPSPNPQTKHRDKLALAAYGGGHEDRFDDRYDDRYDHRYDDRRDNRSRNHDHGHRGKPDKPSRVKIYDAEEDALALVDALAARTIDADTVIDILPALNHDQMLELRAEYKRHCKVQGRGINIAKHIKLKISGNFGKIAHVTALGKYESEGYWANYWYQSGNARRELLIEALMGRQNFEIREIKDAFKDKRYSDSLTRCMDKELKADKFRKAVLMALEGARQEESDVWPAEYRNRDVDTLYQAIRARDGGESTMLSVVVMRSDAHLREVLRTYERKYQGNFARDALKKSNNLVGEVIAHILNGVINRPARDAMLLHHALMDLIEPDTHGHGRTSSSRVSSSRDTATSKHERQQRFELLISRLVRLHWDRLHLVRVKSEYEEKYGRVVEEDVEEATKGDFREFCIALCQTGR
ncbi:hypothetical protein ACN47E_000420 [Coniothyrium glycines]